jgi:Putative Flp pilus-assembly TadE/G-like
VLFALLLPVLILVMALVVDVGNWFVHKRHLQMQADAAALSGGAHFGDCFSPDAATVAGANTAIKNAATAYAGNTASTYNFQVGGGAPRVTTVFNSKTFAVGSFVDSSVDIEEPCQTPHLMFDVKQTEADVPYILGSMVDALVPGGTSVVPAINARARVQLLKALILQGSLPLAVPDVDPKHVTVTYVNESAGGSLIAGPFELTKGAPAGGLNYWQGPTSVSIPGNANVGVRIGVGGKSGACAASNGIGGDGYVCYDYENSGIGLASIRGVGAPGTPTAPTPRVWVTTSCAPSGGPFFVAENLAAPATTCSASVQAVMESSTAIVPTGIQAFDAIVDGGSLKNVTRPLTNSGAYWSTGYVYDIPAEDGPVNVTLRWRYKPATGAAVTTTYTNVQRVYGGVEESSGPVKELALGSSAGSEGAPYALSAGSQTLTVTVGLEGSLDLSEIEKTVVLRLTGGSRTSAVACDGSGASDFNEAIVSGCKTPFQINAAGYCPDPSPPPGPATCVDTKTGSMVGPTEKALDDRFASCPPVNWPDYDVASDPRVVKLLITDFSALDGSGHTQVPVTNFAAFYVTGWTGSKCATNDPPPVPLKKGGIWGHFIKYVAPDPFSGGVEACDPTALTPCVVSLVK